MFSIGLQDCSGHQEQNHRQNAFSRAFHAKNNSQTIDGWRSDLNGILLVFNVRLSFGSASPALTQFASRPN